MILERALITTRPGSGHEFELAMQRAKEVVAAAPGFRSLSLRRGIEAPDTYLLLIEWDTLESHTQGFRESDLFRRWRELIGGFFASAPEVTHYEEPAVTHAA